MLAPVRLDREAVRAAWAPQRAQAAQPLAEGRPLAPSAAVPRLEPSGAAPLVQPRATTRAAILLRAQMPLAEQLVVRETIQRPEASAPPELEAHQPATSALVRRHRP